jgi:hypothetical protein
MVRYPWALHGGLLHPGLGATPNKTALASGLAADFNMVMWSALATNTTTLASFMQQYAAYFVPAAAVGDVVQLLSGLERNWVGPLVGNPSVPATLALALTLAQSNPGAMATNWRLQVRASPLARARGESVRTSGSLVRGERMCREGSPLVHLDGCVGTGLCVILCYHKCVCLFRMCSITVASGCPRRMCTGQSLTQSSRARPRFRSQVWASATGLTPPAILAPACTRPFPPPPRFNVPLFLFPPFPGPLNLER